MGHVCIFNGQQMEFNNRLTDATGKRHASMGNIKQSISTRPKRNTLLLLLFWSSFTTSKSTEMDFVIETKLKSPDERPLH